MLRGEVYYAADQELKDMLNRFDNNRILAAAAYNYIYVFVTGAVSLVAIEVLFIPLAKINKLFPVK